MSLLKGGTVTNAAAGQITAGTQDNNRYGVDIAGGAGIINNYGAITSTSATRRGILTDNNAATINLYAGSSTGAISTGTGNDTLTLYSGLGTGNAGLLYNTATDAITAGTATNETTLQLQAAGPLAQASVTSVNLGGGTNTLTLAGNGDGTEPNGAAGTIAANAVGGATKLVKQDAGTWTLTGDAGTNFSGGTTIAGGTLVATSTTALGTGAVVDHALLRFDGAAGTVTNSVSGTGSIGVVNVGAGQAVTFSGALTNDGGVQAGEGGNVTVAGSVTSANGTGTIRVTGAGDVITVTPVGSVTATAQGNGTAAITGNVAYTVNNAGLVQAQAYDNGSNPAAIFASAGLTVTNSGTIVTRAGTDQTTTDRGWGVLTRNATSSITNLAGGTIRGGWSGVQLDAGSVVNAGTITGNRFAGVDASGAVLNGSVTNNAGGIIQSLGTDSPGVQIDAGSWTVTNAAGATITSPGLAGIASLYSGGLIVDNGGAVQGAGANTYGILAQGTGIAYNVPAGANFADANGNPYTAVITNRAGTATTRPGQVVGTYAGVETDGLATITNSGLIGSGTLNLTAAGTANTTGYTAGGQDGIRLLSGGTISNDAGGRIQGGAGAGVYAQGTVATTLNNSGMVIGSNGLIHGGTNQALVVVNSDGGLIEATNGVGIYHSSGSGTLGVTNNTGATVVSLANGDAVHNDGTGLTMVSNGGTLVGKASGIAVAGAVDVTNTGLIGSGALANGTTGAFTANGQFVGISSYGGTIRNNGGTIAGGGAAGIYSNANLLTVTNTGTISTAGTGTVDGITSQGRLDLTNTGVRDGNGNLTGGIITAPAASGIAFVGTNSTVTNSGRITGGNNATYGYGVQAATGSTGLVTNQANGLVEGGRGGVLENGSGLTVDNSGIVRGTGATSYGLNDMAGLLTLTNRAGGAVVGATNGVLASIAGAQVTNTGTIASGSVTIAGAVTVGGAEAIRLTAGGNVTNGVADQPGALISGGTSGVVVQGAAASTIDNYGTIIGRDTSGAGQNGGTGSIAITNRAGGVIAGNGAVNAGYGAFNSATGGLSITNAATATIAGATYGVYATGTAVTTSVINAGTIGAGTVANGVFTAAAANIANAGAGIRFTNGGSVINNAGGTIQGSTGTTTAGGAQNAGIYSSATMLTVDNSGTISGGIWGIQSNAAVDITNRAGSITGTTNNAIFAGGNASTGSIVRNQATLTGGNAGIYADGTNLTVTNAANATISAIGGNANTVSSGIYASNTGAQITNAGLITSSIAGGRGVYLLQGGTVANDAGGTISATGATGMGVLAGGALTLTNAGIISGPTFAIQNTGAGVSTISLQAGSSTGAIQLGKADDAVTLFAGDATTAAAAFTAIDLGTGANTITLRGSGTDAVAGGAAGQQGTLNLATITGLSTLSKLDAGTWNIAGAATGTTAGATILAGNGTMLGGQGLLNFTGDSGLTGPIYVNGAVAQANGAGTLGTGLIHLVDPTLVFATASATYANNVVLDVARPGQGSASDTSNDPSTFQANAGVTATLTGSITTGTGNNINGYQIDPVQPVVIAGAGTIVLTNAANAWTGTTTINGGSTLRGTTASLSGGRFVDNGTLNFNQATTGMSSRAIGGTGLVLVNGGGNVSLTGAITAAGGVQVGANTTATLSNVSGTNNTLVTLNGANATLNVASGGTLTATNGGAVNVTAANGSLNNAGTISSTNFAAVFFNPGTGTDTATNTGTITGFNAISAAGTLNLTNNGTLLGAPGTAVFTQAGSGTATIVNNGSIRGGTGSNSNGISLNGGGTVTNNAGGTITGTFRGVAIGGASSTVNNYGQITGGTDNAVTLGAGGNATNFASGTLTATQPGGWGVFTAAAGTIDNQGLINADSGLVSNSNAAVFTNEGTINATVYGVWGLGTSVNLTNTGAINAGTTGVRAEAAGSSITNVGTITGTAPGAVGVFMSGGLLTNQSGGVISAGQANGVYGTAIQLAGSGNVLNLLVGSTVNGTIDASATTDSTASYMFGGAFNGGFIGGAGDETVTLISPATVAGTLDGGAGTDTLVLDGTGASTLGSAQVVNFENGIKQGTATWTLTGTTAASPTSFAINAGTLAVAGGNALADTGAVTIATAGTLQLKASEMIGSLGGAGNVVLGANTLTTGGLNASPTFSGVIAGSGGLTKVGTGTLTLSGANTYTGATAINAGTLAVSGGVAIGDASAVTIGAGGTLLLNASEAIGSLAGTGAVALGPNTLTTGGDGASTSFGGNAGGTGGLTKVGTGTQTLSGANTYTGATSVNAGTLALSGGSAIADASAVTVASGATLLLNASETVGSLAGAGAVTLGANTLTAGGTNASTTFSGVASGTGGLGKVGTGTLTLSGVNGYTGATVVSAGTLAASGGTAIADTSAVTVVNGATLLLNASETIGSLAGAGAVTLGANTLTAGGDGTSTAFAGVASGTGGLLKAGAGTLTLAGANTYTGTTAVNAGTLALSGGAAIADAGAVTVASGANLVLNASEAIGSLSGTGNVTLGANTLTVGGTSTSTAFGGVASGTGGLMKVGTGTQTLSGVNTYTGATTVNAGTLALGASNVLADASAVTVASGAVLDLGANSDTVGALAINGTLNGTGTLTAATYALNGATVNGNLGLGLLNQNGATSVLTGSAGATTVNVNAGVLQLGANERIADAAAVTVASGATFNVAGFTDTVGSVNGAGTVALGAGRLALAGAGASSLAALTGTGNLDKSGTGALTLAGNYGLTGSINLAAGTTSFTGTSAGSIRETGGTLTGTGTAAGLLTLAGGTVSPGNAAGQFGTLTVGSLVATGGTYAVDIGGAASGFASDLIRVTGAATLGGTVAVTPTSQLGADRFQQTYAIVQAGSLTGQFANGGTFTAIGNDPTLFYRLRYDLVPSAVVLQVQRQIDFRTGAGSANQLAVAAALNGAAGGASDTYAATLNAIALGGNRAGTLDSLSGEAIADITTSAFFNNEKFGDLLRSRLAMANGGAASRGEVAMRAGMSGDLSHASGLAGSLAQEAQITGNATGENSAGLWLQGYGAQRRLEGRGPNEATSRNFGGGLAAGLDGRLGAFTAGAAGGFSQLDTHVDARASTAEGRIYQGGAYAGYDDGRTYAGASGDYYGGDIRTRRQLTVGTGSIGQAVGTAKVWGYAIGGLAGVRFDVGGGTRLGLQVTGTGQHAVRRAFTESAPGGLALGAARNSRDLFTGTAQVKLSHTTRMGGATVTPYASVGAKLNAGDLGALNTLSITGAPTGTGTFLVQGAKLSPWMGIFEGGLELKAADKLRVGIAAGGAIADRTREGQVKVTARIGF